MLMAEPVELLDGFEDRFRNWRAWCLSRGFYRRQTGSIEGDYSGPQGNGHPSGWGDWDQAAPPITQARVVVNVPDAMDVQRAYVRLWQQSERYARVIQVLVFQDWIKPQRQAQILATHYLRLPAELVKAKKMLANLLR